MCRRQTEQREREEGASRVRQNAQNTAAVPAQNPAVMIAAYVLMIMYELWRARCFRSGRKQPDFYSSFFGIPLAGATLPVTAFFMPGIYGKVVCMLIAAIIYLIFVIAWY